MAGNLLVINCDGPETRVALIENGQLAELYIERRHERGIVGNIYKGKVQRVLPGMEAAFVDIGEDKAAYLHVSDIRGAADDYKALFVDADDEDDDKRKGRKDDRSGRERIEDLLKEGQTALVQVSKGPIGTKGARVTSYVSLPGRHLVYMPTVNHVGISRRIGGDKERKRLRDIIDSMRPPGAGFIVRTVAEGVTERDLHADMEFLIKLWNSIVKRNETVKAATPLYHDLDLLLRSVRDLFTPEVETLILDARPDFERVQKFVAAFMPDFASRVQFYDGREPIFDGYGIESEIDRALQRKVEMRSGGSLVIDEGEALTAVDVNTGKFVGKRDLEETITRTNLEACREIAEQLRLRSIGGIIVLDFIDMDRAQNRDKVSKLLDEAMRRDKARANVTKISDIGLVEMTRKRTRESLRRSLTETCFYCEGRGYLKSKATIAYELLREIRREGALILADGILVTCHPEVAAFLAEREERKYVDDLEKRLQKRVVVKGSDRCHFEKFEIKGREPADAKGDDAKSDPARRAHKHQ